LIFVEYQKTGKHQHSRGGQRQRKDDALADFGIFQKTENGTNTLIFLTFEPSFSPAPQ
jgi:hypothetical protein